MIQLSADKTFKFTKTERYIPEDRNLAAKKNRAKVNIKKIKVYLLFLKAPKEQRLQILATLKKHSLKMLKFFLKLIRIFNAVNFYKLFDNYKRKSYLKSVKTSVRVTFKHTRNNLFITATNLKGEVLLKVSSGMYKKRELIKPRERNKKKNSFNAKEYALEEFSKGLSHIELRYLFLIVNNQEKKRYFTKLKGSDTYKKDVKYIKNIVNRINARRAAPKRVTKFYLLIKNKKTHNGMRARKRRRK